jgi:hypothetical protein
MVKHYEPVLAVQTMAITVLKFYLLTYTVVKRSITEERRE